MDYVKYALKAIAGFVTGVVSAIITRVTTGDSVLPTLDPFDVKGWLILLAIGVLGYLGVYVPRNALSAQQVSEGLKRLPVSERERVLTRHVDPR